MRRHSPDEDETSSQVVRLSSNRRTRTELLRDFRGPVALLDLYESESPVEPGLISEIEPFLSMPDAECYRVVSRQEASCAWAHNHLSSMNNFRWEGVHFSSAWNELQKAVQRRTEKSTDGSALVSLVMCQPDSLVFRQLMRAQAYVDMRSGTAWDLHLIGYTAVNTFGTMRPSVLGIPTWRFSAGRFLDVVAHIQHGHAAGLTASASPVAGTAPWRYSGTADLVSFMAYRDLPGLIDWPSLRAVQLLDDQGTYLDRSIGQIVEIMSDWREDGPEVREFAPGELRQTAISVLDLRRGLIAVAGMVTSGIVGNAAYDLLKQLVGGH